MDIAELKLLIATTPGLGIQTIGVPPSPTRLQKAEDELGIKLPSNYRRFIELYGWLEMGGNSYLGVGFEIPKYLDLVAKTKEHREDLEPRLPFHLIPVMDNGFGDQYCLDTSRMEPSRADVS